MEKLFPITFIYKSETFYAIVRKGKFSDEYAVKVMNADLNNLLHGHHVFIEREGLIIHKTADTYPVTDLVDPIKEAIASYINKGVKRQSLKLLNNRYYAIE